MDVNFRQPSCTPRLPLTRESVRPQAVEMPMPVCVLCSPQTFSSPWIQAEPPGCTWRTCRQAPVYQLAAMVARLMLFMLRIRTGAAGG